MFELVNLWNYQSDMKNSFSPLIAYFKYGFRLHYITTRPFSVDEKKAQGTARAAEASELVAKGNSIHLGRLQFLFF